jgi:hypothetical protein
VYRNPRGIHLAGLVLLLVGVALPMTIMFVEQTPVVAQTIPSDASGGCPVPPATFNGWFQTGTPTANGVVNPADFEAFDSASLNNCNFFQWSEQMFLWLLSPAPAAYGGGRHIFDSPAFYDVSPLDSNNQRTLTRHVSGQFPFVGVRFPQTGPHGFPVIQGERHRLLEVAPAKLAPDGKQLILNRAGEEVEIGSAVIRNGKPVFRDTAGKVIRHPRPILDPQLLRPAEPVAPEAARRVAFKPAAAQIAPPEVVQRFIINGHPPIFLGPLGTLVNPEEGQATGDVLLSQGNSVVYYTIAVNDVYAYFLTGNKTGGIPKTAQFPTTSSILSDIQTFASGKGVTIPDPNALSVEVKMSWVDASTISNPGNYITIGASVPTYDTTDPSQWVSTGTKNITLALVGVHFVAPVFGHPEMVWATFEHFANTPNAAYTYTSTSGNKMIPQDSAGNWLFCEPNCPTGSTFNQSHAEESGANIVGKPAGAHITPSNTLRTNPWGAPGTAPASVNSNTQVVAINNSVLSQLVGADMRKNFFFLGATWTGSGGAPNSTNQVGTNQLANSTMETYLQGSSNCFTCHDGSGTNGMLGSPTGGLSHIYFALQPLP